MIVGALEIQMMADLARLRKDMSEVQSITSKAADTASVMADRIRTAFAALGVGAAIKQFVDMADNMALMEARIRIATSSISDFNTAQKNIYDISQRNMTSIDATTKVFARLNPVVEKLGGDINYTSGVSEALAAALRVSGASTQEASSVMIQFSQAMSSGVLRGEEFNSVSENGSRVIDALSNQLGKSRGELRKMAEEGKLTAAVVGNVLVKEMQKLKAEAASMPLTVAGAFQRLQNDLAVFSNELNKQYGITRTLAEGLEFLRKNLDVLSDALVTGAKIAIAYFAVFKGVPLIVAAVTTAFNGLVAALATFVTGGVLASGTATAMTGVWATLTTGTLTLTSAVTKLQVAMGVIFAAFAGWQIGTWARENFLEVELAGIAMVNGLLKVVESIKFGWNVMVEGIQWAWEKAMSSVQGVFGWFLGKFAEGLEKLGLGEQSQKVLAWAASFNEASRSVGTLTDRLQPLSVEHDKAIVQIDTITGEMADYAIKTHAARNATEGQTGSIKLLKEETNKAAEAAKAKKEAAKALEEAQKSLDKSIQQTVDTILDETTAIVEANLAAQKQIEGIEFETESLKLSNVEREIAIELRKLEQSGIAKGTEAYEEYAVAIRKAVLNRSEVEESIALAKNQAEELKKFNGEIGEGLTDSLFRAFESGKDFFSTFWDGIKNVFKTTVLKMAIAPVQKGVTDWVGNLMSGGSSGGSSGGLSSLFSGFSSLFGSAGTGSAGGGAAGMGGSSQGSGILGSLSSLFGGGGGAAGGMGGLSSMMSMAGPAMAALAVAKQLYTSISGGYSSGLGKVMGAVGGGVVGGLVNRAFGRKAKEAGDSGFTGTVSAGQFSGQQFADWTQKGGWFRSDKSGTDLSALTSDTDQALQIQAASVYASVQSYAKALGLPIDALRNVSHEMRIVLGEDEQKNEEAVAAAFGVYQDLLAQQYSGLLVRFQKAGETLADTLSRLSILETFSSAINGLGGIFTDVATSSFEAREAILGMAGGLEMFIGKANDFVKSYYTEEEQAALQARQVLEYFSSAGIDSDTLNSREAFRALVEAQDVETEVGQRQLVALLDIAPQFAELADYLQEQQLTLETLAAQAPATVALQTFNERQAEYQSTLDRTGDAVEEGNTLTETGFLGLQDSFNDGIAQLNGSIQQLTNLFRAWDNGDSMQVSLP